MLEPIRNSYKVGLEGIEASIRQRRASLGVNATEYELRGLAQWAARQRASTARIWRIPTPSLLVSLEARDWQEYGRGGRTLDNLLTRNQKRYGLTGPAALERILQGASKSNAAVNADVANSARFLRRSGGVLAVAGLAITAHEVIQAPPAQRGALVQRQAVGFAGGLIGAEVGAGLLAVGCGLLATTPPGWIIIGVGLVAGVAGGMIADRVFYLEDYRPVEAQMRAGIAFDPRSPVLMPTITSGGIASTTLPVIRQVTIIVRGSDTQATLAHRAYLQAAASVGLPSAVQSDFAERHAITGGLSWVAGDPSPGNGAAMRAGDIAASAGKPVIFELSATQRAELASAAAR